MSLHHPAIAQIRADYLAENFQKMAEFFAPSSAVIAVVKANAYGHGLVESANICRDAGAKFFAVACIAEGIALREAGITEPILVFGGILPDYLEPAIEQGLDLTVSSLDKLHQVESVGKALRKRPRVHLKIDTGMERIGVHYYSCQDFLEAAQKTEHQEVVGVYSHIASRDSIEVQLERFKNCTSGFEVRGVKPMQHIAASSSAFTHEAARLDAVRPGIALYGCCPFGRAALGLKPVMRLISKVVYFKVVSEGAGVSYGHRWHAPSQTRLATVAIGYGDGAFPRMSKDRHVLIRGHKLPVVGTVCMDQLMVDLGPSGEAYNGDEVVIIGDDISAEDIAGVQGTVAHEIVTAVSARVPRVYISG